MAPPPVRVVDVRAGVAWVSDVSSPLLSRDARDAVRATVEHDRIVSAALAQGTTPLPASLADPYENDAEMGSDVEAHSARIQAAFPAVAGMVEMTTIIAMHDESPPAGIPDRGRAYLEQLRSRPARAGEVADRVERGMSQFGGGRRRVDGGRAAISHLVRRTEEPAYRAAAMASAGDAYRIVVDGPRAPYSFFVFAPRRGLIGHAIVGGTILAT